MLIIKRLGPVTADRGRIEEYLKRMMAAVVGRLIYLQTGPYKDGINQYKITHHHTHLEEDKILSKTNSSIP